MQIQTKDSFEIVTENYREYSKYVIATRAYPSIIDGCKAVHKRCIHCSYKYLPRHLIKSAEASGKITVLHPHPQSIYAVLVSLASRYDCKFPLYETKGNFGGFGFPPAAERYTELMLSDLAIKIFEPFANYVDMVNGEMNTEEPYALATLLPLCFLHGAYGISTGLSNVNIPALNSVDLIKYYLKILESKDINKPQDTLIRPNNNGANLVMSKSEWKSLLNNGKGTAKFSPIITSEGRKLIITNIPDGKNLDNLLKALADEINEDKIDVRDETTDKVRYVVELVPRKRVNIKETEEKINKALSNNESYNFIFADDGIAVFCGLHEVVKRNLEYTIKCVKRKFDTELKSLKYKLTILEIIQKLKTNQKHLNAFVKMGYNEAVEFLMKEYKADREQARSVLSKPISYLTKEHDVEIKELKNEITTVKNNDKDIFAYLTSVYQDLLKEVRTFTRYQDITNFVT